jgi:hypothetical protein
MHLNNHLVVAVVSDDPPAHREEVQRIVRKEIAKKVLACNPSPENCAACGSWCYSLGMSAQQIKED